VSVSKKDRPVWWDRPEGLREAIAIVKFYLAESERLALTRRQLKRACKVLGVHGERGFWHLSRHHRRRLILAGLDPERRLVADEVRWAHTLDYMRATETFKENGFKRWLEEHDEPSAVPARDLPQAPHPKSRKYTQEQQRSEATGHYLSEKFRERHS
jgi:hypothetical protein